MSTISYLVENKLAKACPRWLQTNVHYETTMGSVAYGVSADSSDMDIYGFAIPHKDDIFPHLRGDIPGFGTQHKRFEQYQEHHIKDPSALGGRGRTYDLCVFGIVKYFDLAMSNNPNIVDSLFTHETCVLSITQIGQMVKDNRRLFLHKGAWPKFRGYAKSQLHKIEVKKPPEGKRAELVEQFGYDTKYAYHIVRLLLEAEQILHLGDIDLMRDNDMMKSVRRGEWPIEQLKNWFAEKDVLLERAYQESKLPEKANEQAIKTLLLNCLEQHYGTLAGCVETPDAPLVALRAIQSELDKVRFLLG